MDLYKNKFATITMIENEILLLRWSQETSNMKDEDFKHVNSKYADLSLDHRVNSMLVDVRKFMHNFEEGLNNWRKIEIIPKYHKSGFTKFAFLHNQDFSPPHNNGTPIEGENFITMHFNSKDDILKWLNS